MPQALTVPDSNSLILLQSQLTMSNLRLLGFEPFEFSGPCKIVLSNARLHLNLSNIICTSLEEKKHHTPLFLSRHNISYECLLNFMVTPKSWEGIIGWMPMTYLAYFDCQVGFNFRGEMFVRSVCRSLFWYWAETSIKQICHKSALSYLESKYVLLVAYSLFVVHD